MALSEPIMSKYQAAGATLEAVADISNDDGVLNCKYSPSKLVSHLRFNFASLLDL